MLKAFPGRPCSQSLPAFLLLAEMVYDGQCMALCVQTTRAGSAASGGSSEEELGAGGAPRAGLSRGALRELEQLQVSPSSLHIQRREATSMKELQAFSSEEGSSCLVTLWCPIEHCKSKKKLRRCAILCTVWASFLINSMRSLMRGALHSTGAS